MGRHKTCSPDFAPSDFHRFETLKYIFRGKRFGSANEIIEEVVASIKLELVQEGTRSLACLWRKVV
jgi:hypothetical protein